METNIGPGIYGPVKYCSSVVMVTVVYMLPFKLTFPVKMNFVLHHQGAYHYTTETFWYHGSTKAKRFGSIAAH